MHNRKDRLSKLGGKKDSTIAKPGQVTSMDEILKSIDGRLASLESGMSSVLKRLSNISKKEDIAMTVNKEQFKELIRKSTSIRGGIAAMVKALKDTKTEADFQDMADEVIANNSEYEKLILENTTVANRGSMGGVPGDAEAATKQPDPIPPLTPTPDIDPVTGLERVK